MKMKLWEKIVSTTIWALLLLFVLAGALGGLVYLIREVFMR